MTNITLPYFGTINSEELKAYYRIATEVNGRKLDLDINIENKTIDQDRWAAIKYFLENIDIFNSQNKVLIKNDFENEGETVDYINFYLDEFDEDELANIIDVKNKSIPSAIQLLNQLQLMRVGLYPDGENCFGVFDYTIYLDGEPCNQLLVVKTSENGGLDHITWES